MIKTLLKPFEALVIAWKQLDEFQQARWKLTTLYIVILFIILNLFTLSLFFVLKEEEKTHQKKIQLIWEKKEIIFPNQKLTVFKLNPSQEKIINSKKLIELQHLFLNIIKKWILIIESVLLIISGFFSYFLSGITLRPIKEKNKKQQQFLSDVSHELKNPLSAIKTTIDIVKNQNSWEKGELNSVFIDINDEITRLINTTNGLFLLEKTDRKKQKKYKIDELLRKTVKKCLPLANNRNIRIKLNLKHFFEKLNKNDFETVVFNILHNAIKFSFPNSIIEITLSEKGLFKIIDHGIGISQKNISKVFNRFFKVDDSRTFIEENGSGLGLSIVKKICNENKWEFTVKSEINKGTTFTIKF